MEGAVAVCDGVRDACVVDWSMIVNDSAFLIDGPACISFSGGRTSAYMLWRILRANGDRLPQDVIVTFANTGKEMPQTLDFVRECENRWSVPIVWIEYRDSEVPADRWRQVSYETASRNGEPFEACIRRHKVLPNPVTRFCTAELKIKAISRYISATLGWDWWTVVLGIRADEPRRVAKLGNPSRERYERIAPLARAGICASDVADFWRQQDFDLNLPNINGKTMHGNCDLCFLKGADQIMSLIAENPARAVWWARMETIVQSIGLAHGEGDRFRNDRPSYAQMMRYAESQVSMTFGDEAIDDCACTD